MDEGELLTRILLTRKQKPGKHGVVAVARLQESPFPEQGRELGWYVWPLTSAPLLLLHHIWLDSPRTIP